MTEAEPSRLGQRLTLIALLLGGLLVPVIAIAIAYRSCHEGASRGEVVVTGSALGSWHHALSSCTVPPGAIDEVTLARDDGTASARVFYAGDTALVELTETSGNRTIRLDPKVCKQLAVRPRGAARDLRGGSLVADCAPAGGGHVTIDAWWQRCRASE